MPKLPNVKIEVESRERKINDEALVIASENQRPEKWK